jgi:hypothetical protein
LMPEYLCEVYHLCTTAGPPMRAAVPWTANWLLSQCSLFAR